MTTPLLVPPSPERILVPRGRPWVRSKNKAWEVPERPRTFTSHFLSSDVFSPSMNGPLGLSETDKTLRPSSDNLAELLRPVTGEGVGAPTHPNRS